MIEISSPNVHLSPEVQIERIITKAFESAQSPTLIAVGGPGGVGKSTFCSALCMEIPDSVIVRLDDYKIEDVEKVKRNVSGPAPEANRMDLLEEHLKSLSEGKIISKPRYNHVNGTCDSIDEIAPGAFVILDGEVATYERFSKYVDFSIYIDSHWKTQLKTRTERDITLRGYPVEKAIYTFLKSNLEEFPEHGAPSRKNVDMLLWCDESYHLTVHSVSPALWDQYETVLSRPAEEVSLEKMFVAVTTPFRRDRSIDFTAFAAHLRYLESHGVDAVFLGGTTGEFDALTFEEKEQLLQAGRKAFGGVITFNVSSTSLHESLALVRIAEKCGANAITALPPYYRAEVGEEGVAAFFKAIAHATSLPFILYNFTRHTQNEITPELMKQCGVDAVKDSDKNLGMIDQVPLYLCAGDSVIAEAVNRGARGVVSVQGNYRPAEIVQLFSLAKQDHYGASKVQEGIADVSALFRKNKQIARIKQALSSIVPKYPPYVRLPLVDLNEQEKREIEQWCARLGWL